MPPSANPILASFNAIASIPRSEFICEPLPCPDVG
jgi:hypothetical protein